MSRALCGSSACSCGITDADGTPIAGIGSGATPYKLPALGFADWTGIQWDTDVARTGTPAHPDRARVRIGDLVDLTGVTGWTVTTDGSGNQTLHPVDGGGGGTEFPDALYTPAHHSSAFGSVSGGNVATGEQSFIGAGGSETVSGDGSAVLAGDTNTVTGEFSAVVAGDSNSVSGDDSAIGAGHSNQNHGDYSFIGGGGQGGANTISTDIRNGFIGGGSGNHLTDPISTTGRNGILAGSGNEARSLASGIVAGAGNATTGIQAVVGAGQNNIADGLNGGVFCGRTNSAYGENSAILGGKFNGTNADNALVVGNNALNVTALSVLIGGSGDKVGFYNAIPVVQAATPTTLADVITLLTNLGLCV